MSRVIISFFILCFSLLFAQQIEVVDSFGSFGNTNANVSRRAPTIEVSETVFVNPPTLYKKEQKKVRVSTPILKESKKKEETLQKTIKEISVAQKREPKVLGTKKNSTKARLLIIIDDITTQRQINFLKSLPYKVTPSIFPPNRMNMHTPKLAKNLKHFMIHLPLQSDSKAMNRMHKTLFIYDSDKKIKKRVAEIRKLFPSAKYVNNHTGSVFTADYKKSKVLVKALSKEGFVFVDSRTTDHSTIRKIKRELHLRYIKNDIFIDNIQSVSYSLNKLKKAIALAKKRGYAVVIGHPHPTTFEALKRLKPYLQGVQTVYVDEF